MNKNQSQETDTNTKPSKANLPGAKGTMDSSFKKSIDICTELIGPLEQVKGKQAWGRPDLFWPSSTKVLKVQFLDGESQIEEKVIATAKK